MEDHSSRLLQALLKQHQIVFNYDTGLIRDEFREYIDCPVCQSNKRTTAFKKDWFIFSRCTDCGMVYLNPRLNDKATYQFYESEWNHIYNETKFDSESSSTLADDKKNDENLQLINKYKPSRGSLLEIGIGKGYFLRQAQDQGYDVYGVELNKKNCESASKLLGASDHIYNTDLFSVNFESNSFDVIYMRDVFEHVPNPRKMLAELNRIAKKGCVLFIQVPNIEGWIYKIVKERHVCFFAFEHLNYWSPQSLSKVLSLEGFAVQKILHQTTDFTPNQIINHFLESGFTSIEDKRVTGFKRVILKFIERIHGHLRLWRLDTTFKKIANLAGRGSEIIVLATKQ